MADSLPAYSLLRGLSPVEVVSVFRNALLSIPLETVSEHLFSGVVDGSILPHIFEIWVDVSKSPVVIKAALRQTDSLKIRRAGIRQFGKRLRSKEWKETWDGLGSTEGLLDLLSGLSVLEVKQFSGVVLRSTRGPGTAEIFQLLRSLLPKLFPAGDDASAPHRNPDERPLAGFYEPLVRKCPREVVGRLYLREISEGLDDTKSGLVPTSFMLEHHSGFMQDLAFKMLFEQGDCQKQPPGLLNLLHRGPGASKKAPKFSASMQFSLDLLKRLASAEHSNFDDDLFVKDLVEPLLKRCKRRDVEWRQVLEIVQLAAEYMSRSADAAAGLSKSIGYYYYYSRKLILDWTARLWADHPADAEEPFKALVRMASQKEGGGIQAFMFPDIAQPRRYAMLRLCFLAVGWGDLDVDSQLKGMAARNWKSGVFSWLAIDDAWALYERLLKSGVPPSEMSTEPDKLLLSFARRRGKEAEAVEICIQHVEKHKKKAMSSKDQNDRALHAKQAMQWAVTSKSLEVYKEAVLWARRYIRDPLTVPELHQYSTIDEQYLLTGDPGNLEHDGYTVESLRQKVVQANEILWIRLETVLMALREPSFNVRFWRGSLGLFYNVVSYREEKYSKLLKEAGSFSEDDIYTILWEDTLPLLLRAEKVFLQPGHERLEKKNAAGALGIETGTYEVTNALPSTYRFFDELAKERDRLWRDYRPSIHAAVAALPEPYPRGLPIECLTGLFQMRAPQPDVLTPYIASRARAVLFMDPAKALTPFPEDEETQMAIGRFVDSYQEALEIYVPSTLPAEQRKERVDEVWKYAVGPLSKDRMNSAEAFRYWRKGYYEGRIEFWPMEYQVSPCEEKIAEYDPRIPPVKDASEVIEWNPDPPSVDPIKERKLNPTYIDVIKDFSGGRRVSIDSRLKDIHSTIPGLPAYYRYTRVELSRMEDLESDIVLALLLLDTKNGAKRRVLSAPFPSEKDIRYPSIYLDEHFLAKSKMDIVSALDLLETRRDAVPTAILLELIRNTLEVLESPSLSANESIDVERIAFGLINVLAQSDNPSLGIELAISTILDRPEASSWHRQLLSPTLLRRLPPAQSRACVDNFTAAMLARLQEQAKAKPQEDTPAAKKYVKATTVKHLAQLLNGADYILPAVAVSVLQRLLHECTHPDIRSAVLESLLTMLSPTNEVLNNRIITALETVVPIFGSLDGRTAMSEEAWQTAEQRSEPPELPMHSSTNNMPPLLSELVVGFLSTWRYSHNEAPWRAPLTSRVILPALDLLTAHTARWLHIFLHQHRTIAPPDLLASSLPSVPINPAIWRTVLDTGPSHLPTNLLTASSTWALFNARPPPAIAAFNTTIQTTPALRADPHCQRFLSLYALGLPALSDPSLTFDLPTYLASPSALAQPAHPAALTPALAHDLLAHHFAALLAADDATQLWPHLARFLARLERPRHGAHAWATLVAPVVRDVIATIEGGGWAVRPDVLALRLSVLAWPVAGEGCERFAEGVVRVLEGVVREGTGVYHRGFERVRGCVVERVGPGRERCGVAVELGRRWEGVVGVLAVELAVALLEGVELGEVEEGARGEMEGLVKRWAGAEDEGVRRLAYGLVGKWKVGGWVAS